MIELRDVTFSYKDEAHVLKGVSLRIGAGQTLALVGPSGAGKTTLCNLIPRADLLSLRDQHGAILSIGTQQPLIVTDDYQVP